MQKGMRENNKRSCGTAGSVAGVRAYIRMAAMVFAVLTAAVTVPALFGEAGTASAYSRKIELKDEGLGISAEVMLGKDGVVKRSKNVPVNVKITNGGDDFSGIIRVRFNSSYHDSEDAMIEQAFDIAAGQSKTVQLLMLPLYNNDVQSRLIELCDKDGKVLEDGKITGKFDSNDASIFVGVLSDDASGFGYLKNFFAANAEKADEEIFEDYDEEIIIEEQPTYIDDEATDGEEIADGSTASNWAGSYFELTAEDINDDSEYLDMYDVIIIDNFDTSTFRPEQITAVKTWVRDGGLLVLSTGGNPDKVLKGFAEDDDFKVDVTGSAETVKTSFGMTRDDIIQYSGSQGDTSPLDAVVSNLVLGGKNKTVLKDGKRELLQRKVLGTGAVMVSEFSLSLPQKVWNTYGGAFLYVLGRNLGKQYFLDTANYGLSNSSYYSLYGVDNLDTTLRRNESKSLPNLALYTFLLLAYVAVAGPILYFVLHKKDKRTLLWGAIPMTAVVFSLLIYILGSSTRIHHPYIKYLSEISLDSGDEKNLNMNTYFSVTSPSNRSYYVDLKKDMHVMPSFTDMYSADISTVKDSYVYGVHREGDSLQLDLAAVTAFSDEFYNAKQKMSLDGGIDMDLDEAKGKLTGTVTNNTKYALEHCFVCYDMELYHWSEIPAGQSVSIQDAEYYPNAYVTQVDGETMTADADYVMQAVISGVCNSFGYSQSYDFVSDNRAARMMAMASYKMNDNYMSSGVTTGQSKCFYGFLKEEDDNELFPAAFDGMEYHGVTAVTKLCD